MDRKQEPADTSEGREPGRATPRLVRDMVAALLIVAAAVALGLFQNSVSADPLPLFHREKHGVTVITDPQQVAAAARAGAVLVDARSGKDYATGHIESALNLPFATREKLAQEFARRVPSSTRVIVYCDTGCDASARLAEWLVAQGWVNVAEFTDGMSSWSAAALPVSTGAQP
jgi:rhodanese-related sulfurtransferase